MPTKNAPAATESRPRLSFEEALVKLEELVSKLEGGKLGLSDSLLAYQEGVAHLRQCYQLLEEAELRIAQVSAVDEQGRPKLEAFHDLADDDQSAAALTRKAAARSQRRSGSPGAAEVGPKKRTPMGRDETLFHD